ncbi:hypothetical protein V6574_14130 [Streptomyces sp. SM1P]
MLRSSGCSLLDAAATGAGRAFLPGPLGAAGVRGDGARTRRGPFADQFGLGGHRGAAEQVDHGGLHTGVPAERFLEPDDQQE